MTRTRPSLCPYINVKNASAAIDFYCAVFGARELFRLNDPGDGRIGHAQLQLGDTVLMLSDEYPDFGALGPAAFGGSPVKLHLEVDDVDRVFAAALEQGATSLRSVQEQFYGSKSGVLTDPFGHVWHVETSGREINPQEMQETWNQRAEE